MGVVRVLHLKNINDTDKDGKGIGDNWTITSIQTSDEKHYIEITTDHVHGSECDGIVPSSDLGIARLIAECINRTYKSMTPNEFADLVTESDRDITDKSYCRLCEE